MDAAWKALLVAVTPPNRWHQAKVRGSDFEAFIPAHLNAPGQSSEFDRVGLCAGDAEEGVLGFRVQI